MDEYVGISEDHPESYHKYLIIIRYHPESSQKHFIFRQIKHDHHSHNITGTCCRTSSSTSTLIQRSDHPRLHIFPFVLSSSDDLHIIVTFIISLLILATQLQLKRMHTSWMGTLQTWQQSAPTMSGKLRRCSVF